MNLEIWTSELSESQRQKFQSARVAILLGALNAPEHILPMDDGDDLDPMTATFQVLAKFTLRQECLIAIDADNPAVVLLTDDGLNMAREVQEQQIATTSLIYSIE